ASVKTRITELKDFARITLEPGAMQTLHFELKPYQLSLLNDKMDRVVEPGEFKILVGGVSPAYKADDRIKDSLGYPDSSRGLSMMLDYPRSFAADFTLAYGGLQGKGAERTISVKVSNKGNLTDVGKVYLYIDGLRSEEFHHYELAPGQSKMISFVLGKTKEKHLDFTTKYKNLSISL
ncbi:MAG: fibronectin type III-like domain-contianing protein, partial [Tannerella sp.]|nr:fibronectin type III-like domain-contianing protein [Tannerella sp.]